MKLFYKKEYKEEVEKNKELKTEICTLTISLDNKKADLETANNRIEALENYIVMSDSCNDSLSQENKQLQKAIEDEQTKSQCSKGGYTKKINELTKEVEELKVKLADAMSDKYVLKKIPSGRTPNSLKTKVKQPIRVSVQRHMKAQEKEKYETVK